MHRVMVAGGTGKTGREVVRYLSSRADMNVVGVLGRKYVGSDMRCVLANFDSQVPILDNFREAVDKTSPTIWVDFSPPEVAKEHFLPSVLLGIHPIIGSTGFSADEMQAFSRLCEKHGLGGALIPNFSLGALIMLQAARLAAQVFNEAAIVDIYNPDKRECPSGTSKLMVKEMKKVSGFKHKDISTHSLRLSGVLPHQEVVFGGDGESLTIQHDVSDRQCYGPGVAKAILSINRFERLVTDLGEFL